MPPDPYEGLGVPVQAQEQADPYAGLGVPPEQANKPSSYMEDVQKLAANPGQIAWNDIQSIPGTIVAGAKALGSRAYEDVKGVVTGNPQQVVGDVGSLARKFNPLVAPIDSIVQAIKDPESAVRSVVDPAHPVQSALNLLTVESGGGLTAARGALKLGTKTADITTRLPSELFSGVSSEAQKIASKAGELGGPEGAAFRSNIVKPDYAGMQDALRQGVRGAADERSANYQADMAKVGADKTPISYQPIRDALEKAWTEVHGPGGKFVKDSVAKNAIQEAATVISKHVLDPTETGDAISMDALKQGIGFIGKRLPEGADNAKRVIKDIYDATKEGIVKQAPDYAGGMERYQNSSQDLNEIVKSLGAGDRATRFSTAGKLLSALRSDASVARGARADALSDVARHAPTLPYQIAGATMNPVLPRGIVGRGKLAFDAALAGGVAGGAAAGFLPHVAAALPGILMSSPRLVGNVRYGVGVANRGARAIGATQANIGRSVEAARLQGLLGEQQSPSPRGLLAQ